MKRLGHAIILAALFAFTNSSAGAGTLLYDLDFTPPDIGSYWVPPGSEPTIV